MFGAYYGLAAAWYLGIPAINIKEKASYTSDLFSLLGTIVLWVYWPSFVAGATPAGTPDAELQLVQTILALVAATVTTFALSAELSEQGKLRPVDVQNATLAGGVSIGILAGTPLTAAGAILVGSFAGALSTFGFAKVCRALCTPWPSASLAATSETCTCTCCPPLEACPYFDGCCAGGLVLISAHRCRPSCMTRLAFTIRAASTTSMACLL
jgi:hypothetical protein